MLCYRCNGTGKYLGNGMMQTDCNICDGLTGTTGAKDSIATKDVKIDRRSQSYKDSIKEIMALNPDLTKEDAVKLFDETYNKV